MDKIYLLSIHKGDCDEYYSYIDSAHKTLESATKEKQRIEKEIDFLKMEYTLKTKGRDWDEDIKNPLELKKEVRWLVWEYKEQDSLLSINTITIKEMKVYG
jgi:hypothetical protein